MTRDKRVELVNYRIKSYLMARIERRLREINDRAAQSFREKRA